MMTSQASKLGVFLEKTILAWVLCCAEAIFTVYVQIHIGSSQKRKSQRYFLVGDISEKCGTFESFRNFSVWLADNFVNGLFPAWVSVATFFDVGEKFTKRSERAVKELIGYLDQMLENAHNDYLIRHSQNQPYVFGPKFWKKFQLPSGLYLNLRTG